MPTWENQPPITVSSSGNGTVSLEEHLKKQEVVEQRRKDFEVTREVIGDAKALKGIIYHKVRARTPLTKSMIKKLSSSVKEYTMADQFALLLEQSGEKGVSERFQSVTPMKKRQLERLLGFNKRLSKQTFLLADTVREFKGNGSGDPSRDLLLLQQAGILRRKEKDNGQVEYSRVTTDEKQVAVALVKNMGKLVGYPPTPRKKTSHLPQQQAQVTKPITTTARTPVKQEPIQPSGFTGIFAGFEQSYEDFKKIFPNLGLETFAEMFMTDRTKGARA